MRRRPPPGAAIALSVAKSLVLLVVVALCFGLVGSRGTTSADVQPPSTTVDAHGASASVARAIDLHDCSEAGFDPDIQARSALIRRHGALRHVPFEEGWAVFTERRPGVLLALCLDEPPRR